MPSHPICVEASILPRTPLDAPQSNDLAFIGRLPISHSLSHYITFICPFFLNTCRAASMTLSLCTLPFILFAFILVNIQPHCCFSLWPGLHSIMDRPAKKRRTRGEPKLGRNCGGRKQKETEPVPAVPAVPVAAQMDFPMESPAPTKTKKKKKATE